MDDYIIYAVGGLLIVSVALLFVQVSTISGRIDYVEQLSEQNRIDIVQIKSRYEELDDITKDISDVKKNLKELSTELQRIDGLKAEISNMKEEVMKSMIKLQSQIDSLKKSSAFFMSPLQSPFVTIVIRRGDTLAEVANAYNLGSDGLSMIAKLNNMKNPNLLHIGEKIKVPYCLECNAVLPFDGKLSKGIVSKGFDEGGWIKFTLKKGTAVLASMPGRIVEVKKDYIRIDHGSGVETSYRFDGKIFAAEGDWVKVGQHIGILFGDTLFFSLMVDGEPRDPFRILFSYLGGFQTSFYTEWEDGVLPEQATFRLTRSETIPREFWTVAADPSVIPLGTLIYIPEFSRYPNGGIFYVEDTGGAIKGRRIDIYIRNLKNALMLSRKEVRVYVYKEDR